MTLIIPGYSISNKDWAYKVKDELKDLSPEVFEWTHWSDKNIKFSAKDESQKIKDLIVESETNIIAKSIGTLSISYIINEIKINKVIFCGIPINDINSNSLAVYQNLGKFDPKKIMVFQNENDRHGNFEDVKNFLFEINRGIQITKTPGSTHDYPYFQEFINFLK